MVWPPLRAIEATPDWLVGGGVIGGGSATPNGQIDFFKKNLFGPWGGRTTPKATVWPWGGFSHPILVGLGGRSQPQGQTVALGGSPATLRVIIKKKKKGIFLFFIFFKY